MIAKKKKNGIYPNWLEQKLQTKDVILKYFSLNSAVLAHIIILSSLWENLQKYRRGRELLD